MISVDLPSFSDPNPNFISFNPEEAKGIQCRFGERGVTAATHYDGGRNMIGMISGAKRYILAPPLECPKVSSYTYYSKDHYHHQCQCDTANDIDNFRFQIGELQQLTNLQKCYLFSSLALLLRRSILPLDTLC